MARLFIFLALLLCLGLTDCGAATYYASPTGTGDGLTAATPASFTSARSLAASASASSDVTVYFRGGTYSIPLTVTLASADGGRSGHTVSWTAYPGETPVFSGGIQVTGWTLYDSGKNIWKATVPSGTVTRQLYVNGARATRSYLSGSSFTTSNSGATYVSNDSTVPTFSKPAELEIFSAGFDWAQQMVGVASATRVGSTTTLTMDGASTAWNTVNASSSWSAWPSHPYLIENAYEFLSASTPGCWYLDTSANTLYYVPKAGENMATADVELPITSTLFTTAQSDPVANLQISGITFAYTGWTVPTTQKSFLQQQASQYLVKGDWSGVSSGYVGNAGTYVWANAGLGQYIAGALAFPPGGIALFGAQNVTFTGCTFQHMGGSGLEIGKGSKYCTADHNTFTDISANGVKVGDVATWSPSSADQTSYNTVTNNTITSVGIQYIGGVGIFAGYTDHIKINNNEVGGVHYTGISLGWGWNPSGYTSSYVSGNEIGWNKIHDVMTFLYDGGAIYTTGVQGASSGLSVHDNYIYNFAVKTLTSNKSGGPGGPLYADQGTNFISYSNNVISKNPASVCTYWTLFNVSANTGTNTINASGNYATSGLTSFVSGGMTNGGSIASPTAISGTTISGWPTAAQTIALAAGPLAVVATPSLAQSTANMRASFR